MSIRKRSEETVWPSGAIGQWDHPSSRYSISGHRQRAAIQASSCPAAGTSGTQPAANSSSISATMSLTFRNASKRARKLKSSRGANHRADLTILYQHICHPLYMGTGHVGRRTIPRSSCWKPKLCERGLRHHAYAEIQIARGLIRTCDRDLAASLFRTLLHTKSDRYALVDINIVPKRTIESPGWYGLPTLKKCRQRCFFVESPGVLGRLCKGNEHGREGRSFARLPQCTQSRTVREKSLRKARRPGNI